MRIIFIIFLGIIVSPILYSNDSVSVSSSLLGIQTGYGFYRYEDPLESANIYGGSYIPINFDWITHNENHVEELSFSYSNVALKSTVTKNINETDFKAMCFNINYGYHLAVYKLRKVLLFAGANLNTYLAFRDLNYHLIPPINGTYSYQNRDVFVSINLSIASKIDLGDNLLFVNINSSLLSFVTNRAYDRERDSENDFLFFPKFNSFNFRSSYYYKITQNLYLNLSYLFSYYSYPRSLDILVTKGAHNQIVTGLNLKF
jgi:hypothetical protein